MDIKKLLPIIIFVIACNQNSTDNQSNPNDVTLDTFKDSLSYSMGINIGKNLPSYADILS